MADGVRRVENPIFAGGGAAQDPRGAAKKAGAAPEAPAVAPPSRVCGCEVRSCSSAGCRAFWAGPRAPARASRVSADSSLKRSLSVASDLGEEDLDAAEADAPRRSRRADCSARCHDCWRATRLPVLVDLVEDRVRSRSLTVCTILLIFSFLATTILAPVMHDPYNVLSASAQPRQLTAIIAPSELAASGVELPVQPAVRVVTAKGDGVEGAVLAASVEMGDIGEIFIQQRARPVLNLGLWDAMIRQFASPFLYGTNVSVTNANGLARFEDLAVSGSSWPVRLNVSFVPPPATAAVFAAVAAAGGVLDEGATAGTSNPRWWLAGTRADLPPVSTLLRVQTDVYYLEAVHPTVNTSLPLVLGQVWSVQPAVRLRDLLGNPIQGRRCRMGTVPFSDPRDPLYTKFGFFDNGVSDPSDANGVARFHNVTLRSSMSKIVLPFTICDDAIVLYASAPQRVAGQPGSLTWASAGPVWPTSVKEGEPITPAPQIQVRDAGGNPMAGVTVFARIVEEAGGLRVPDTNPNCVTCSLPKRASKELLNAMSRPSDANGIATFVGLQFAPHGPAGTYRVAFESAGVTPLLSPATQVQTRVAQVLIQLPSSALLTAGSRLLRSARRGSSSRSSTTTGAVSAAFVAGDAGNAGDATVGAATTTPSSSLWSPPGPASAWPTRASGSQAGADAGPPEFVLRSDESASASASASASWARAQRRAREDRRLSSPPPLAVLEAVFADVETCAELFPNGSSSTSRPASDEPDPYWAGFGPMENPYLAWPEEQDTACDGSLHPRPTVVILDAQGNGVPGKVPEVWATLTSRGDLPSNAILPNDTIDWADGNGAATGADGYFTFSYLRVMFGATGTTYALTFAVDGVVANATLTVEVQNFLVDVLDEPLVDDPGCTRVIALENVPSSVQVNAPFSPTPVFLSLNSFGRPIPGTLIAGEATIPMGATQAPTGNTSEAGTASITVPPIQFPNASTFTFFIGISPLPSSEARRSVCYSRLFPVTVINPVASIAINAPTAALGTSTNPITANAGEPFAPITLEALDAFGLPVRGLHFANVALLSYPEWMSLLPDIAAKSVFGIQCFIFNQNPTQGACDVRLTSLFLLDSAAASPDASGSTVTITGMRTPPWVSGTFEVVPYLDGITTLSPSEPRPSLVFYAKSIIGSLSITTPPTVLDRETGEPDPFEPSVYVVGQSVLRGGVVRVLDTSGNPAAGCRVIFSYMVNVPWAASIRVHANTTNPRSPIQLVLTEESDVNGYALVPDVFIDAITGPNVTFVAAAFAGDESLPSILSLSTMVTVSVRNPVASVTFITQPSSKGAFQAPLATQPVIQVVFEGDEYVSGAYPPVLVQPYIARFPNAFAQSGVRLAHVPTEGTNGPMESSKTTPGAVYSDGINGVYTDAFGRAYFQSLQFVLPGSQFGLSNPSAMAGNYRLLFRAQGVSSRPTRDILVAAVAESVTLLNQPPARVTTGRLFDSRVVLSTQLFTGDPVANVPVTASLLPLSVFAPQDLPSLSEDEDFQPYGSAQLDSVRAVETTATNGIAVFDLLVASAPPGVYALQFDAGNGVVSPLTSNFTVTSNVRSVQILARPDSDAVVGVSMTSEVRVRVLGVGPQGGSSSLVPLAGVWVEALVFDEGAGSVDSSVVLDGQRAVTDPDGVAAFPSLVVSDASSGSYSFRFGVAGVASRSAGSVRVVNLKEYDTSGFDAWTDTMYLFACIAIPLFYANSARHHRLSVLVALGWSFILIILAASSFAVYNRYVGAVYLYADTYLNLLAASTVVTSVSVFLGFFSVVLRMCGLRCRWVGSEETLVPGTRARERDGNGDETLEGERDEDDEAGPVAGAPASEFTVSRSGAEHGSHSYLRIQRYRRFVRRLLPVGGFVAKAGVDALYAARDYNARAAAARADATVAAATASGPTASGPTASSASSAVARRQDRVTRLGSERVTSSPERGSGSPTAPSVELRTIARRREVEEASGGAVSNPLLHLEESKDGGGYGADSASVSVLGSASSSSSVAASGVSSAAASSSSSSTSSSLASSAGSATASGPRSSLRSSVTTGRRDSGLRRLTLMPTPRGSLVAIVNPVEGDPDAVADGEESSVELAGSGGDTDDTTLKVTFAERSKSYLRNLMRRFREILQPPPYPHAIYETDDTFYYPQRLLLALALSGLALFLMTLGFSLISASLQFHIDRTFAQVNVLLVAASDSLRNSALRASTSVSQPTLTTITTTASSGAAFAAAVAPSLLNGPLSGQAPFLARITATWVALAGFDPNAVRDYLKDLVRVSIGVGTGLGVALMVAMGYLILRKYRSRIMKMRQGEYFFKRNAFGVKAALLYVPTQTLHAVLGFVLVTVTLVLVVAALYLLFTQGLFLFELIPWMDILVSLASITLIVSIVESVVLGCFVTKGAVIHHRRVFALFDLASLVYNLASGIGPVISRLISTFALSLLFFVRIDLCQTPESIAWMDPGFAAYVGMIRADHEHNNPVLVVLADILTREMKANRLEARQRERLSKSAAIATRDHRGNPLTAEQNALRKRLQAKLWLGVTLFNNPQLIVYRLGRRTQSTDANTLLGAIGGNTFAGNNSIADAISSAAQGVR